MPFGSLRSSAIAVFALLGTTALALGADPPAEPVAPGKFIPAFAVKYGGSTGWPDLEEAARFDLLVAGAGCSRSKAHPSLPGNTWQVLKRLNPHLVILLYEIGPGEYNTADWGQLGQGWDWIVAQHGPGTSDRWTAVGAKYGECLQGKPYPNERLMLPGNPGWQQYWLDHVYAKFWGEPGKATAIADGIFSDNTRYAMPWQGNWHREGRPDLPDVPLDYSADGQHDEALYHQHMKSFFARAFPWMAARGRKVGINFGDMARRPETWEELDNEPAPPFAAMEEGAFVHPWGSLGRKGNFVFWPEKEWLNQIEAMRKLKHVRALMNVHGPVASETDDIRRMDAADASGNRAWDVLWYSMMSFLQGYDDVRQNAYMNFTVWGYLRFYWFKEFDPQYLHLGRARGDSRRVDGREGHVYLREFDDGWAVVNPTGEPAQDVAVPQGEARVVTHDSLERPDVSPCVRQFDLAAHRGIILLKSGRAIGNSDNR